MNFEKLGIDEDFNGFYQEIGIKSANEVQIKTIPSVLGGRNTICIAPTGTGKTLAYALPTCELVKRIEDEHGVHTGKAAPMVLVVAPTKELATQIHGVYKQIAHYAKLRVRSLVGGQKNKRTSNLSEQSFEVLIGTLDKIAQALERKQINLEQLKYLVLDEVDTLMEASFKKGLDKILGRVSYKKTQLNFFSATLSDYTRQYIEENFEGANFKHINIGRSNKLKQSVKTFNFFIKEEEKLEVLASFLEKNQKAKGIVFVNQKKEVEKIAEVLETRRAQDKIVKIHGDLTQKERLANFEKFSKGSARVLIATDVMARGIDISDLTWILNWNLPKNGEFYLHRCGRVARNSRGGVVYNLISPYDSKMLSFVNEAIKNNREFDLDLIKKAFDKKKKPVAKKKAPPKKKVTKRR